MENTTALSDRELAELVSHYETDASPAVVARWRALFDPAARGPIVLINRMKVREGGRDELLRYSAVSVPALTKVGGRFIAVSYAVTPLFDTPAPERELTVVGWYPDRAALLALLRDPAYREAFRHRRAALESQWVVAAPAAPI